MAEEKTESRKPFHESIIDAIQYAGSYDGVRRQTEYLCLSRLIKGTRIPKGHDAIIEAWRSRSDRPYVEGDDVVILDLLEQKREAEENEKKEEEAKAASTTA